MLIDWFTVAAQALNFLILVFLLRRFLYQPILDAIDQREKRIAAELAAADAQQAQAQQERELFQAKNASFDQTRAERLRQLETEVQHERTKRLEAARTEASSLMARHQAALENEQLHLQQSIQRKTAKEVFAIARQALTDLADAPLEAQMVAVFLRRLAALTAAEQAALRAAFTPASEPLRVQTRFALSEPLSAEILTAVRAVLGPEIELSFESSDRLINGIELSSQGQKLAWSLTDYLSAMEDKLGQLLSNQQSVQPAKAEAGQTNA